MIGYVLPVSSVFFVMVVRDYRHAEEGSIVLIYGL